ncbi:type 1 fimbrial protein [Serratia ureilytica]|uniref:Type 1 fimbrial protein n=1 Tax=Serratia ureilytica TaxID=300181 RepID=A0A9X9BXD1_9GAMM|nr:type 1 fimbrial protein [Serratia ureilytica]TXE22531.1 type 1 fimbrial protein [Serratia ureilytica]
MKQPGNGRHVQRLLSSGLGISMLWVSGGVRADESYNLASTILLGTCTVTTSNGSLTLPNVSRDELDGGLLQQQQRLVVSTSSCVGVGDGGSHPTLTVSGTTVSAPANVKDYLFNDGGTESTAKGYGITVSTKESTSWDTDNLVKNGGAITLSDINSDNSLWVSVGCGDATTCAQKDADHAAGSLSAGITFTFKYQ